MHIRQYHSIDILIMELAVALQWFNPAVWLFRKALKETHEYLADREVIAQGFDAEGYRLLLFEQQFGAKLFEFASHLKQSQIKRRMFMMNRMKRASKVPFKILLALPLIAFLALALAEPRLISASGAEAGGDEKGIAGKDEKQATAKQECKKMLADIEEKVKLLDEKLHAAATTEEKQKLKQALADLLKKRQVLLAQLGMAPKTEAEVQAQMDQEKRKQLLAKLADKEEFLNELYSKADSPEKKQKIKEDLNLLFKKRQELMAGSGMTMASGQPSLEELQKKLQMVHEKNLKLEQLIAGEKDENRARELKAKREELLKLEEELRIKIEKGAPPEVR